jgi:hypothetical protein
VALSVVQIQKSLQQRVCSGFSPDSLLNVSPEWKKHHQNGGKATAFYLIRQIIRGEKKIISKGHDLSLLGARYTVQRCTINAYAGGVALL